MWYDKTHVKVFDPKQWYDLVDNEYKKYWSWLDSFCKIEFGRFLNRNDCDINILDLWAGDGRLRKYLSKLKYDKYFVCDISEKLLSKHPGKVQKFVFNLEDKFPFESDTFDLATSFFVIEHLYSLENFLNETYRVLKIWWKLIIWYFLQRREFLRKLDWVKFKIKMYKHKIDDIKNIAQDCFFDVVTVPVFEKSELIGYIIVCEKN